MVRGETGDPEAIIIHRDSIDDKLIIYAHPNIAKGLQISEGYKFRHDLVTTLRNQYDYPNFVYYTNSIYDRVVSSDLEGLHNSSLSRLLFGKSAFEGELPKRSGQEFYNRFRFAEYGRIVSFLYSNIEKELPIELPGYLMVSAIFSPEIDFSFNNNDQTRKNFVDIYERIVGHYNDRLENEKTLKAKFLALVERNIVLDELFLHNLLGIKTELVKALLEDPLDIANILHGNSGKKQSIIEFIDFLDAVIDERSVSIGMNIAWIDIKKTGQNKILSLLVKMRNLRSHSTNFLQLGLSHEHSRFSEPSSGELSLLTMVSRLFATSDREQAYGNLQLGENVLVVMDEPELYLHPIYQKSVIYYLVKLLPQIYVGKKVQLILTSHSPFIISDLPKKNICFFGNAEKFSGSGIMEHQQTFAANVHTLLSDSFFMDNGFTGTFAKTKLNEVIADLNTRKPVSKARKGQIKKIITIIGEPILKRKLLEMYNNKFNLDIDDRLDRIENILNI